MKLDFSFRPSARVAGISVTALIFFLLAWKTGIGLLYIIVAFLLSLLIVSASFSAFQMLSGSIRITRRCRDGAIEGDLLEVEISIVNEGVFSLHNLQIEDNFAAGPATEGDPVILIGYIGGGRIVKATYRGECFRRGFYTIGPILLTLSDPFGLFFFSKEYKLLASLLVYPQIFKIYRFPLLQGEGHVSWFGIETTHISGADHEFYGIREYRPKDPIKNIHWRSSVRLQELIVKQFERCNETHVTIMLDLMKRSNIGIGKETTLEYAVKIAASIAKYLLEDKCSVQLLAYEKMMIHLPFDKGSPHFLRIYELLSTMEATGEVSLSRLLVESEPLIPKHSNLILVALDTDLKGLQSAIGLMAKEVYVRPFVLLSSSFAHFEKEEAIQAEIRAKQIDIFSGSKILPYFFYCGDNLESRFRESVR